MAYQQSEEDDLALALTIQLSLYEASSDDNDWPDDNDRPVQPEEPRKQQQTHEALGEVEGRPAVTHQQVNGYIDQCKQGCDGCRHMMQMTRLIVTEAKEWCRKNFEIWCYGEHFSIGFWAGARENKFVVQVVAGKVHVSVTNESWRMWFQRIVQESWNVFKDVAVHVIDKAADMLMMVGGNAQIAGAALRAIDSNVISSRRKKPSAASPSQQSQHLLT